MTSVLNNNSTTQPLLGSAVFFGAWVSTTAFQAIKVSVLADQIGTLIIQHATTTSPSNIIYQDTKPVDSDTETFLESIVKSAFFRVKFENGTTTQTSFKLQTTSGLQYGSTSGGGGVASEVEVTNALLAVNDASSVALLQELVDTGITIGAVDISGVSPINGRLPTYDASGVEQLTTIAGYLDAGISVSVSNFPATQDISGSVSVSNQITGFATESTLEEVATTAEDISLQLVVPQRSWIEVDFDTQSSQIVSGAGTWRVPLTGEEGWEYVNSTIGGATAYFYSNTSLVAGGLESNITLGSLTTMWFIGNYRLATEVNPNRRFYLSVYTKPQGAGDFQPWYRSSKTYQLPNSAIVSKGADVMYYAGLDISTIYKEYDHTAYELAVSRGNCDDNEIIQFMSLAVDSETPANEFDGLIKHAGFSTAGGTNRVVSFTRASREKIAEDNLKSLTVEMGTLQVNMAGFSFNGSDELLVTMPANISIKCDDVLLTQTPSGTKNCLDVSVDNIVACDTGAVVVASGSVDVSGVSVVDAKLNVFDLSANEHLIAIEDILETGFVNVYDASCELVLDAINTQTEKLTFVDVDANTGNLKVIDLANNEILSQLSFFTNEDTTTDLKVRVTNTIEVINPEAGNLAVSGNVGIIADQVVGITGSVQAHCFGSQNGTDFHHLKTTATGELVTHSQTRDGAGTAITSTPNGGITALDVAISGTATVSGLVQAKSQDAYAPQVASNTAVSAPVQIGTTADSQGFLWVAALLTFTSVTTGGQIYIEVSPDSSNWARPSAGSVFVTSSVSNVTASILLGVPVAMRYVRLYADSPFVGVGCNAFFSMK